jgi:benzoyl-CoA reductase/2-hydroxyglutaryl-CoA dehydratase subunit BcrC/BadD/HgdB
LKDLKHLIYFENLLEEANNELCQQAKAEGMHPIGYTCYHMPEVVLNVDNCFSVRLRAPKTGTFDIASYYMSNYTCEYCRALVERAIEGGYNFLDAIAGVDACAEMNRCMENIEILAVPDMPEKKMFVTHCDIPYKVTDYTLKHYVIQIRNRFLNVLAETYGVDTSDKALRKAVKEHNEVCDIITEIGEMRKLDNPPITGYEFHVLCLVTYCCPKAKILPYLKEIKKRKPDPQPWYRARVAIVGSEIDDLDMTRMVEQAGAFIVSDRFCFGSTPGRERIELNDEDDVLTQICAHYLKTTQCPRYMSQEKIQERRDFSDYLAKEYKAEGIIYEAMKFCDFWAFERTLVSHIMNEEYGWPVLSIDRPYMARTSGQLRTRLQAFVESLEIKQIQKAAKEG